MKKSRLISLVAVVFSAVVFLFVPFVYSAFQKTVSKVEYRTKTTGSGTSMHAQLDDGGTKTTKTAVRVRRNVFFNSFATGLDLIMNPNFKRLNKIDGLKAFKTVLIYLFALGFVFSIVSAVIKKQGLYTISLYALFAVFALLFAWYLVESEFNILKKNLLGFGYWFSLMGVGSAFAFEMTKIGEKRKK